MHNPVVIFVRKERFLNLANRTFPIGISVKHGIDGPAKMTDYAILLLDDTAPIPNSAHGNMRGTEPLLIIAHGGSELHKARDIPYRKELSNWGRPFVCGTFSHIPGDSLFAEIMELVTDPTLHAEGFATSRRNQSRLEWVDGLAAICQLMLIDATSSTRELEDDLLSNFPLDFGNEYSDFVIDKRTGEPDWAQRLKFLQTKAVSFTG